MSVLACKVIAGLMTLAGQDGTAAWCREPSFLERCAARLEEMMGDPKVGILTFFPPVFFFFPSCFVLSGEFGEM